MAGTPLPDDMRRGPRPGPLPPPYGRLARDAEELLVCAGLRHATVAEALGCSAVMVWRWCAGIREPSLRPGTAGARFLTVLKGLAAADTHLAATIRELQMMDDEGHGDRWAKYDSRWIWVSTPKGPQVVRAGRRRRGRVLLRDGVREPGGPVDPAGQRMASGAYR